MHYARLMYDLIVLAFQTDSTRVCSYVVRTELAGGVYPEFGVSKGYHALTHHGNDPQNLEELAKVDTIYMTHWAYFLNRLKSIQEGNQTLLDRTVLGFSSGMGIGHSKVAPHRRLRRIGVWASTIRDIEVAPQHAACQRLAYDARPRRRRSPGGVSG